MDERGLHELGKTQSSQFPHTNNNVGLTHSAHIDELFVARFDSGLVDLSEEVSRARHRTPNPVAVGSIPTFAAMEKEIHHRIYVKAPFSFAGKHELMKYLSHTIGTHGKVWVWVQPFDRLWRVAQR